MSADVMVEWLRSQILARKAVAEAATRGEWDSDDGGSIHVGHPTHVVVDWITNEEDLAHVLLQQPQDTIARCEVELLLLDEHHCEDGDCSSCGRASWEENPGGHLRDEPEMVDVWRPAFWPCRTVRTLAVGYRRRPGWNPDWAEGITP